MTSLVKADANLICFFVDQTVVPLNKEKSLNRKVWTTKMDIYALRYRANCVDYLINRLYLDLLLSNMTNVLKKVRLNVQTSCTVEKRQRLIAGELGSCGTCFILWIDGSNISNRDDIWSNAHFTLTWCKFSDLEQSRTICTMWFSLQWTQGILLHC